MNSEFGIAKLNLALRNWHLALRNWHCEIRIANFGIAKFSLRILALRNFRIAKLVCELIANFGNAKFR